MNANRVTYCKLNNWHSTQIKEPTTQKQIINLNIGGCKFLVWTYGSRWKGDSMVSFKDLLTKKKKSRYIVRRIIEIPDFEIDCDIYRKV